LLGDEVVSTPPTFDPARTKRLVVLLVLMLGTYAFVLTIACSIALAQAGGPAISPARVEELYIAMWVHAGIATAALLAWMEIRRKPGVALRTLRVVLCAAVLAGLVSLDRVVGVVCPPPPDYGSIFDADVVRGWRHHPNSKGAVDDWACVMNSHGLRGADFPLAPATGEFRIMFLGDSIPFGYALEEQHTYPALTERLLRERWPSARITAMNAGVCGYATWQEVDYLKHDGIKLRPDLLVLTFCHNDFTDLIGVDPNDVSGILPKFKPSAARFHWSGLVRAVRTVYDNGIPLPERWKGKQYGNHVKPEEAFAVAATPQRDAAVNRALKDLDELDTFCRERKVPWILVPYPLRAQFEKGGDVIRPEDILRDWAKPRGVPVFDLRPAFAEYIAKTACKPSDLYVDGLHPSTTGARLTAEKMVEYLVTHRLIQANSLANQASGTR